MQSAQEYAEMMHRSNGPPMQGVYANGPHPLSAGGRMEGGYGQQGMDYDHVSIVISSFLLLNYR